VTISWPKSVLCLRDYNAKTFSSDLVAGITVGLVALPLAMAFAISSGVKPENGLYCAVITGFLISALGGSKVQIGGPTGAFVVVVSGIIAKHGIDGLYTCMLFAGLMLVVLGLTGMGTAVKFIPRPVVIGFTNGIALLIASTQIKDFFGLKLDPVPGEFFARMEGIVQTFPTFNWEATTVATASLIMILLIANFSKRIPGGIIALVFGTVVVTIFNFPVETIGTRFGGIPAGLPHFIMPTFHFDRGLLSPALTVAMLGAIESLLSATVADRMTGDKHNPNVELFAQGVANLVSPLFAGLPATGAIARTATNIRSGAKTPVAGMIHALTILFVLVFAAKLASFVPLCVLAAILLVVAYNMGEWREIPQIIKLSWSDKAVWALTFGLTVFADLTIAVEFGMTLAALTFIRKVTNTTTVTRVTAEYINSARSHILQDKNIPEYATLFRIHGPFLFGATDKIEEVTSQIPDLPPIVILRLRNMTAIDATGLQALEDLASALKSSGRGLILCGAREQPRDLMNQAGFVRHIGKENFCSDVEHALERAAEMHEQMQLTKQ